MLKLSIMDVTFSQTLYLNEQKYKIGGLVFELLTKPEKLCFILKCTGNLNFSLDWAAKLM
jgi:hypothetical protein